MTLEKQSPRPAAKHDTQGLDPLILACFMSDSRSYLGLDKLLTADMSKRERHDEPRSSTY